MRLAPLPVFALAFSLTPACWPSEEDLLEDEARAALTELAAEPEAEVGLPGRVYDPSAPVAEALSDDPDTTLTWPLSGRVVDVEAARADAFATDGEAIIFAGVRDGHATIVRLEPEDATATRAAATLDGGPIAAERVALVSATRHTPATAAWADPDGAIWAVITDARLGDAKPVKVLDPEDGKALGGPVLAPSDDGNLVCVGSEAEPLRCATIETRGNNRGALSSEGWWEVGKAKGLRAEVLIETTNGWVLVAGSCRPKDTCRRQDLVAIRLGADALPPRKRPTLPLPELQSRRGGLLVVPDATGFVLIGKRVAAGESSAWRVTDHAVRELDGKWSRVVGGLDSDDGLVFVEQAPLAMQDGFPVVRHRPRPFDEGKRGDALGWPSTIASLVPTGVDQHVISTERLLVFVAPIRKHHVHATVVRLDQ